MHRKLFALFSAAAVLYLCGAAEPMSSHTNVVKLMDYDRDTEVIVGYPDGQPPLGWYVRTQATQHLVGAVGPLYPPNPCRGLTIAWNELLTRQAPRSEDTNLQVDDDRPAIGRILFRMAVHQCNVEITSDTSRSPEPVLTIRPVP